VTASASVGAPPAVTQWIAATVKNYATEAQRPVAVFIQAAGSITFTDGVVPITVNVQGMHFISPLDVTAASGAFVCFQ
jgi:predicted alpha/beta hydrolase family esterase